MTRIGYIRLPNGYIHKAILLPNNDEGADCKHSQLTTERGLPLRQIANTMAQWQIHRRIQFESVRRALQENTNVYTKSSKFF